MVYCSVMTPSRPAPSVPRSSRRRTRRLPASGYRPLLRQLFLSAPLASERAVYLFSFSPARYRQEPLPHPACGSAGPFMSTIIVDLSARVVFRRRQFLYLRYSFSSLALTRILITVISFCMGFATAFLFYVYLTAYTMFFTWLSAPLPCSFICLYACIFRFES